MKPGLQKIYDANIRDFSHLSPAQLMAITLWAEARGEPRDGKISVASVILERVNHRGWDGKSIHEVCLWPRQFSCFNPDDIQRPKLVKFAKDIDFSISNDKILKECYDISNGILTGNIQRDFDIMRTHCCQYLNAVTAAKTRAKWIAAGIKSLKIVGRHEFFAEPKR